MAETSQICQAALCYPEEVDQKDLVNESWLLSRVTRYQNLKPYVFFAPGLRKHESLGRVFPDIRPKSNEGFDLELAVELPAYLPSFSGKLQYVLQVTDEEGTIQQVVVSNQMGRVTFSENSGTCHALVPRHRCGDTRELGIKEPVPLELLWTFVAHRSNAIGPNADAALENCLEGAIRKLFGLVNQIVSSLRETAPSKMHGHIPVYDPLMFQYVYMAIRGRDAGLVRTGRIAVNAKRATINPEDLTDDEAKLFTNSLASNDGLTGQKRLMFAALAYLEQGLLPDAIVQMAVAAEIGLGTCIHQELIARGVSRKKLKDVQRDITFSHMLNVFLPALYPKAGRPADEIIAVVNKLRKARNEFMHTGKCEVPRNTVRWFYGNTEKFIGWMETSRQIEP